MSDLIELKISLEEEGQRIDKFLGDNLDNVSRSAVQKLIESANILVNDNPCRSNYKLRKSDRVTVNIPEPTTIETKPENIPLDIRYEDSDLLVVNKKKGMVVHPAAGNYDGTLVNALLYHCKDSLSGINGNIRPGIVHRIDKDTSGLLIVAKNDFAHKGLAEQIKAHSFKRKYEAIAYGNFKNDSGTVNAPIGRHPVERKKMCVTVKNSKEAVTHYQILNRYVGFTHLSLRLETGRTHQIRVHMSYIGHPLAGDLIYGPKKVITELGGQCLHAKFIGFVHPRTGKYIEIDSELPDYFNKFMDKLILKDI